MVRDPIKRRRKNAITINRRGRLKIIKLRLIEGRKR